MLSTTSTSALLRIGRISAASSLVSYHTPCVGYLVPRQCYRCFTAANDTPKRQPAAQQYLETNIVPDNDDNNTPHEEDNHDELPAPRIRTKRLDVAIVGYPNAGKSQLLNAMVGTKVAAVSRKRHTTREGILGVASHDQTQLVFCDTPGFMTSPMDKIGRDLTLTAKASMADVDVSLVVIDAAKTKLTPDYMNTISALMWNALHSPGGKFAIVLNKVDLVQPKPKLLDVAQTFAKMADQMILEKLKLAHHGNNMEQPPVVPQQPPEELMPEVFFTCARQGSKDEGVQEVVAHLRALAVPGRDWLLPDAHQVTPMDYPHRVQEILREKVYRVLHREVPHQIEQRNRQLELVRGDSSASTTDSSSSTTTNSVMLIQQDLLVRTKSHLNLLQKGSGMNLQRIHDAAVPELRRLFDCEVLLTLSAKLISRNRR